MRKASSQTAKLDDKAAKRSIFGAGLPLWVQVLMLSVVATIIYFGVLVMAYGGYENGLDGATGLLVVASLVIHVLTAPVVAVVGDGAIQSVAEILIGATHGPSAVQNAVLKARIYVGSAGVFAGSLVCLALLAWKEHKVRKHG